MAEDVCRSARAASRNLCGLTTQGTFFALVENASVVVTNDTGTSHVAAATRTPSVVVASGSDVARWRPLDSERHIVFGLNTPCRPCQSSVCPFLQECVAIEPSLVSDAALRLVAQHRSPPVVVRN